MHRLLLSLSCCLMLSALLTAAPAQAEWVQLAEADEGEVHRTLYYEPRSLIRARKPKVSVMVIAAIPSPHFSWRSVKFLWEANCQSREMRLLGAVEFAQMGTGLVDLGQSDYQTWSRAGPAPDRQAVMQLLCP